MNRSTLQTDQWHSQGGQSRLDSVGSVLAVSGTELLHEEVETLLAKLESLGLRIKSGLQGLGSQFQLTPQNPPSPSAVVDGSD